MDNCILLLTNANYNNPLYSTINNTIIDYRIKEVHSYSEIYKFLEMDKVDFIYIVSDMINIDEIKKINFISLDIKIVYVGDVDETIDLYQTSHLYHINETCDKEQIKKVHRKGIFEIMQRKQNVLSLELKKETLNIPYKEIIYLQSEGRYVNIYTMNMTHKIILKLDQIEDLLNNTFYRTHQSYIVNITEIRKLTTKYCLIGKENIWIPIANGKFNSLKDTLLDLYITNNNL